MEKKGLNIEKKGMSQIETSEKQSWRPIAFNWAGMLIAVPMLMIGGTLGGGMSFGTLIIAAVIAYALIALIMSLVGSISSDMGIPAALAVTKAFGDKGSTYLTSLIFLVGCIGWFAMQNAAAGAAVSMLFGMFGVNFPAWAGSIILGIIMVATSVLGFHYIKRVNYVIVPILIVSVLYGVVHSIIQADGGMATIFANVPETQITLAAAISICIGTLAVASVVCGDFFRYSRGRKDTVLASFIGVVPMAIFVLGAGAVMAIGAGQSNITLIFAGMGLHFVGMLVLILATWTNTSNHIYIGGLACMKVFNLKDKQRPIVTMILGAVGVALAITGVLDLIVGFVTLLAAIAPPVAGVIIADYWIIGRGKPENWYRVKGFNWIGIISWACGAIVGRFFSFYSTALDAILVAIVLYIILYAIFGKTSLAGQGRLTLTGEEETADKSEA